jgi:flagellar biosynthesis protein FlhF
LGPEAVILSNRKIGDETEILAVSPQAIDALTRAVQTEAVALKPQAAPALPLRELLQRAEKSTAPAPVPRPAAQRAPVAPKPAVAAAPVATTPAHTGDKTLLAELRSMKGLLADQLSSIALSETMRRSPLRSRMLRTLLGAGFSPALARGIVGHLPDDFSSSASQRWLIDVVSRNIPRVADPEMTDVGGVYALVGPTGVGKTTTVAKLAARYVMKHGTSGIGLITTDDYRVGAHDQLRVYARLLGVPIYVAQNAQDLRQGLDAMAGKHLVLIDTTGMSQRDSRIAAQHELLISAGTQRLLVLNATAQAETLEDVAQAYSTHGGRTLPLAGAIITKTDEAARTGCALDVVIRRRLPLHYTTAGQRVPEDIERVNPDKLALDALKNGAASTTSTVFSLNADESGLVLSVPVSEAGARA